MDPLELLGLLFKVFLVNPMTNILVVLAAVFGGSFGIAIIIFTIVMRGLTFPLTTRQIKASRAMSTIQPRLQEIQKKHKDPKRRSEETMKLYKEAGVNPMGCILPMLIQFPIWIGLYQTVRVVLGSTPESFIGLSQRLYPWSYVREALPLENHFLWMDLAQPDGTFLLAIIVGSSTWVQQKMMTPRTITDERQQSMNSMMLWMMPLMFAWFTLTVPSGLALYWAATNMVGVILQYFYMRPSGQSWREVFFPAAAPTGRAAPASTQRAAPAHQSQEATDEGEPVAAAAPTASQSKSRRRRSRGRRRGRR
jgi:YidC/Oxa1 family membrane protein insertase